MQNIEIMGLFSFFQEKSKIQRTLLDFDDRFKIISQELYYLKRELKNVEIIALESREKYAKKLKKLLPSDKEEETNNSQEAGMRFY